MSWHYEYIAHIEIGQSPGKSEDVAMLTNSLEDAIRRIRLPGEYKIVGVKVEFRRHGDNEHLPPKGERSS